MIWAIVAIVGILTPFCYSAFEKWIKVQKAQVSSPVVEEYVARLTEAEDQLESAKQRIENLESIVVTRLLEDPSKKEKLDIEASEMIAQNAKLKQR